MHIVGEKEYFAFLFLVLLQFLVYRHAEDRFQPPNNHSNQHVPLEFLRNQNQQG